MTSDANSVKNRHEFDPVLDVCRLCGRGLEEIENDGPLECTGNSGVTSIKYARWRREAQRVFGPIINPLLGKWQ